MLRQALEHNHCTPTSTFASVAFEYHNFALTSTTQLSLCSNKQRTAFEFCICASESIISQISLLREATSFSVKVLLTCALAKQGCIFITADMISQHILASLDSNVVLSLPLVMKTREEILRTNIGNYFISIEHDHHMVFVLHVWLRLVPI